MITGHGLGNPHDRGAGDLDPLAVEKKVKRQNIIVLFAFILWAIMIACLVTYRIEKFTCHNQCAHGNRACQDRCFKQEFCPEGDLPR